MVKSFNIQKRSLISLHNRPNPNIISREVAVNTQTSGFYFADYNMRTNTIYFFMPVWVGNPNFNNRLYNISENYNLLFPIVRTHEMQHWYVEQIDTSGLGFSGPEYLMFHAMNEHAGHSAEIFNAVKKYENNGKDWIYLSTLSSGARTSLKNSGVSVQNLKLVANAATQSLIDEEYEKDIAGMARRSIKYDESLCAQKGASISKFKKNLSKDSLDMDKMHDIWRYTSKIQVQDNDVVDMEKLSVDKLASWIKSKNFDAIG